MLCTHRHRHTQARQNINDQTQTQNTGTPGQEGQTQPFRQPVGHFTTSTAFGCGRLPRPVVAHAARGVDNCWQHK